jgi:hypothetical protein
MQTLATTDIPIMDWEKTHEITAHPRHRTRRSESCNYGSR